MKLNVPSLHVWGALDEIVRPEYSQTLSGLFDESKRVQHIHNGGHMIPSDKTSRAIISRFVLDRYDEMMDGDDSWWLRAAL